MLSDYECLHCGKQLPSEGGQQCPYCGKMGRKIKVMVADSVGVSDDLAIGITQGETGRYAVHSDSAHPTDTVLIEEYVQRFVEGRPGEFQDYLDGLVARFASAATFEGVFYRGVNSEIRDKIEGSQIGPSPTAAQGRYNVAGEKCIYLIDNLAFVHTEVDAAKILVQEYRIALSQMKVANLTPENTAISNSLSLIFQMTERGKTGAGFDFEQKLDAQGNTRYLVSQCVALTFKRHGWQGLYVPGVHGSQGLTYKNLALFGACVDSWREWADGEYRFL